jgi:hypothetical protein
MNIESAQYVKPEGINNECIKVNTGSQILGIPIDPANADYAEIMRQVDSGTLTIEDTD